mmetsp:Transcript_20493/g.44241  ORF Transcript_20493/g.44241 Transcript_20493/m.44241 type:complete len:220 (-) Transcript_20493:566-1225(-)
MLPSLLPDRIRPCHRILPSPVLIIHTIPLLQDLKPSLLQCRQTIMRRCNIRQPISLLNLLLNQNVFFVVGIILVSKAPFITGKDGSRLENTVDFRIAPDTIGSMTRRLDSIGGIKRRRFKGLFHEVTLSGTTADLRQAVRLGGVIVKVSIGTTQLVTAIDLVLIQCQSCNIGSGEFANISHWSTDATSDIQHFDTGHGWSASLLHFLFVTIVNKILAIH